MRSPLLPQHPAIIWLTGLSGSGKTTLAARVKEDLQEQGVLTVVLDGDALRTGLNAGLGFSAEDRRENVRRTGEVAILMAEAGMVVIVALISPFQEDREAVAKRSAEHGIVFADVYVNTSLAECERRDPKLLYKRARAGEIRQFTGIDSPYEPPLTPALEICTEHESVDDSAERLHHFALVLVGRPSELSRTAWRVAMDEEASLQSSIR